MRLTELLAKGVSTVGAVSYGCAVLSKAFDHSSQEAKVTLANALLSQPDLLMTMAKLRHGHMAAKHALQFGDESIRMAAVSSLAERRGDLMNSRYGRVLNKHLETLPACQ